MNVVGKRFLWTEERVLELTALWAGTMSATEIGAAFGISRCSVLGKVHRLNLPSRLPDHGRRGSTGPQAGHMLVRTPRPRKTRLAPKLKSVLIVTKFGVSTNVKAKPPGFKAPYLPPGKTKTSPEYRNQFGMAPETTVRQRRDVIAEALLNTARMQAGSSR